MCSGVWSVLAHPPHLAMLSSAPDPELAGSVGRRVDDKLLAVRIISCLRQKCFKQSLSSILGLQGCPRAASDDQQYPCSMLKLCPHSVWVVRQNAAFSG